jgi:hypothetical protein
MTPSPTRRGILAGATLSALSGSIALAESAERSLEDSPSLRAARRPAVVRPQRSGTWLDMWYKRSDGRPLRPLPFDFDLMRKPLWAAIRDIIRT